MFDNRSINLEVSAKTVPVSPKCCKTASVLELDYLL